MFLWSILFAGRDVIESPDVLGALADLIRRCIYPSPLPQSGCDPEPMVGVFDNHGLAHEHLRP